MFKDSNIIDGMNNIDNIYNIVASWLGTEIYLAIASAETRQVEGFPCKTEFEVSDRIEGVRQNLI